METLSVPVNLIRQWCYCPRVVYYMELMRMSVHRPVWVKQGEDFHQLEEKLWQRRNLSCFDLQQGKKHYRLAMQSEKLGLHGIADLVIETNEAVYPVEFKLSASNKKRGDVLQLIAYGMLARQHFQKPVSVAFLVGRGRLLYKIAVNEAQCQQVMTVTQHICRMLEKARKPETSASLVQCGACEYVNFCNDRL